MSATRPLSVEVSRTFRHASFPPSFRLRPADGFRHEILIDMQITIQVVHPVSQPVVYPMPPNHLEMETVIPTIVDQTGLLRREESALIHPHQILREDDTSLQLYPSGVFASRKIDRRTRTPILLPTLGAQPLDFSGRNRLPVYPPGRKSAGKGKRIYLLARLQEKPMCLGRLARENGISRPNKESFSRAIAISKKDKEVKDKKGRMVRPTLCGWAFYPKFAFSSKRGTGRKPPPSQPNR